MVTQPTDIVGLIILLVYIQSWPLQIRHITTIFIKSTELSAAGETVEEHIK